MGVVDTLRQGVFVHFHSQQIWFLSTLVKQTQRTPPVVYKMFCIGMYIEKVIFAFCEILEKLKLIHLIL